MHRVTAQTAHTAEDSSSLQLEVGDVVSVSERGVEWPAFVHVQTARGDGWVPARYLSADSGPATVRVPYDTTELPVAAGESVQVITRDDTSGWWWCKSDSGTEGWVPIEVFDISTD